MPKVTTAMSGTLADLSDQFIEMEEDIVEINVTPFYKPHPEGLPRYFKWRSPDAPTLYRVGNDSIELMRRFPDWNDVLAMRVAVMAACHVWPEAGGPMGPGMFYANIAANPKARDLWLYLDACLTEEFPHLGNMMDSGTLKKIILERATSSPAYASAYSVATPSSSEESIPESWKI